MARLRPLTDKAREEFDRDPYLRDIVERNFEIAAQCCIDIGHRTISLEDARKPADYYEAILILRELGVVPAQFARQMAPIAGFRNILVLEYLKVDWDHVYAHLQSLNELERFGDLVRRWLAQKLN